MSGVITLPPIAARYEQPLYSPPSLPARVAAECTEEVAVPSSASRYACGVLLAESLLRALLVGCR